MARFVNKKEIARVVKILTDELVGLKFELYFVVAFDLSRNVAGAEIYPHLIRIKRQLRGLCRRCFTESTSLSKPAPLAKSNPKRAHGHRPSAGPPHEKQKKASLMKRGLFHCRDISMIIGVRPSPAPSGSSYVRAERTVSCSSHPSNTTLPLQLSNS